MSKRLDINLRKQINPFKESLIYLNSCSNFTPSSVALKVQEDMPAVRFQT